MAKMRIINTRFWIDDYVSNLDPTEKLLFLYFLTSPQTDICGVYEVPLKVVATETGIDKDMVQKIIKRFSKDKKIFYSNGWVAVTNFRKHQSLNPKVERGIEIGLSKAPKELVDKVNDSLSIAYDSLSHPNLNSNPNSNPNEGSAKADGGKVNEIMELFREVNPSVNTLFKRKTERDALGRLLKEHGEDKLRSIIAYLPKSNASAYAPTITTPYALERDLGKLIAWSQKQKSKLAEKEVIVAFS